MTRTKKRIACVVGTRPEAIKLAPVINLLLKNPDYQLDIINSGQHRDLLDTMLDFFNIKPTIDFNAMRENQSLALLTAKLFEKFAETFKNNYDLVLVLGDTTTTLVAAQVAFYHHIPIGHIEAGLRSFNLKHPFPEEMNRVFTSIIADLHFTPTEDEAKILLAEGIKKDAIFVTGNTVIDSLLSFANKKANLPLKLDKNKRLILVTLHRRESFGEPLRHIFKALVKLTQTFDDIEIVYPIHPNPNVHKMADEELKGHQHIHLIEPVTYDVFVTLMQEAYFIMSDSGGIQEEAPALHKPLLILREVTERPLVVKMGMAKLVGTDEATVFDSASELLSNKEIYRTMQKGFSPYGDGQAAQRIIKVIDDFLLNKVDSAR